MWEVYKDVKTSTYEGCVCVSGSEDDCKDWRSAWRGEEVGEYKVCEYSGSWKLKRSKLTTCMELVLEPYQHEDLYFMLLPQPDSPRSRDQQIEKMKRWVIAWYMKLKGVALLSDDEYTYQAVHYVPMHGFPCVYYSSILCKQIGRMPSTYTNTQVRGRALT